MSVEAAPDDGARARRIVSVVAPLALLASLAGAVLAAVAPKDSLATPPFAAGMVLMAVGVLAGVGCLWHGARNEHERGRWFAVAAVFIGLVVGAYLLFESRYYPRRLRL